MFSQYRREMKFVWSLILLSKENIFKNKTLKIVYFQISNNCHKMLPLKLEIKNLLGIQKHIVYDRPNVTQC